MIVKPSERSKQDILEIAQFIAQENTRVAIRFLENVDETFDMMSTHPAIGHTPVFDFAEGLQTTLVKGFKHYHIFYRVVGEVIRIDRIADGRRDLPSLFEYMSKDY